MKKWGLLEVCGIELEYMLVDREHLNVLPVVDQLLRLESGKLNHEVSNEVSIGELQWSNELALHVIEIKNPIPQKSLIGMELSFQNQIQQINQLLKTFNAQLLPTAMHPWMQPENETKLWPHLHHQIYSMYNQLFDCRGHGWSNLQSTHINLSFSNDNEFARLHAAVRLILPLIPTITASSPVVEGKPGPGLDSRLWYYKQNQKKIRSIMGDLIPEAVWTRQDYENQILMPMYQDIATQDPEGFLQEEWLNSRAAIPKFARDSIEIRIMDIQECPLADLALSWFFVRVIKKLCYENWSSLENQKQMLTSDLRLLFEKSWKLAESTEIDHSPFLRLFGFSSQPISARQFFQKLLFKLEISSEEALFANTVEQILERGSLASAILKAIDVNWQPPHLHHIYQKLGDCLNEGRLFE